jgi:hypothetical protein
MLITQKEKKEYELAPEGMIAAVCVDVIDIGEAMGVQPDDLGRYCVPSKNPAWQPKPRARWGSELETKMQDGRPFVISADFPASLFKPEPGQTGQIAKLRDNLDNWGVELPTEGNIDLKGLLLGKGATLRIKHNPDDNGRVWANVSTINPETKALEPSGEWDPTAARDRIKERALKSTVQAATDAVTEDNQPY